MNLVLSLLVEGFNENIATRASLQLLFGLSNISCQGQAISLQFLPSRSEVNIVGNDDDATTTPSHFLRTISHTAHLRLENKQLVWLRHHVELTVGLLACLSARAALADVGCTGATFHSPVSVVTQPSYVEVGRVFELN